jgi:hypothetical protein
LKLESPHIVHLYNISKNNFKLAQKIWQLDNYDDKQDASNYNNYCNSWRKLHGIRFEDHIMEHDSPTNLSTYIVLVRKFFFWKNIHTRPSNTLSKSEALLYICTGWTNSIAYLR